MACQVNIPNPEYPIGTRANFTFPSYAPMERTHRDWWLEDELRSWVTPGEPPTSSYYCSHDWVMHQIGMGRIMIE